MGILVCSLVVSLASVAFAGVPSLSLSTAVPADTNPVSVYSNPDGSGDGFNDCYLFGGGKTDATITLTLVDGTGAPINLYPSEDLWLESASGGLQICAGGTAADFSTDALGQTVWANPIQGGGYVNEPAEGCIVMVNGSALTQPAMSIYFNSADINGDLTVNVSDVSIFAAAYFSAYAYSCDYVWDGSLIVNDVSRLAPAFGAACP
jgi:hypothetical protein